MNGLKHNAFKSCDKVQGGLRIHTHYSFDIVFLNCKLQKNPVSKKKKDCHFFTSATSPSSKYTNTGKKKKQDSSKLRAASFSLPVTLVSEGSESWGAWHPVTIATLSIMHEPLSYSSPFTHTHILRNFQLAWMEFFGQKDNNFIWPLKQQQSPPTKKTWKSNSGSHSETHTPHQKASKSWPWYVAVQCRHRTMWTFILESHQPYISSETNVFSKCVCSHTWSQDLQMTLLAIDFKLFVCDALA